MRLSAGGYVPAVLTIICMRPLKTRQAKKEERTA